MKLSTSINNGDRTYYTDLNGFQVSTMLYCDEAYNQWYQLILTLLTVLDIGWAPHYRVYDSGQYIFWPTFVICPAKFGGQINF